MPKDNLFSKQNVVGSLAYRAPLVRPLLTSPSYVVKWLRAYFVSIELQGGNAKHTEYIASYRVT